MFQVLSNEKRREKIQFWSTFRGMKYISYYRKNGRIFYQKRKWFQFLIETDRDFSYSLWKWGLLHYAKSIDPGQPAHYAQPDLSRNFLLQINFLHIKRTRYKSRSGRLLDTMDFYGPMILSLLAWYNALWKCFYAPVYLRALVFTCLRYRSFKNTVEKEEIAPNENFSFSHSLFYPSEELSPILIKFEIVVCKIFLFGKSLKFVVWERVKPPLARVWFIYLKANIREQGQKEHMFFGRFSEVK